MDIETFEAIELIKESLKETPLHDRITALDDGWGVSKEFMEIKIVIRRKTRTIPNTIIKTKCEVNNKNGKPKK